VQDDPPDVLLFIAMELDRDFQAPTVSGRLFRPYWTSEITTTTT
jgi:hypothetical protein